MDNTRLLLVFLLSILFLYLCINNIYIATYPAEKLQMYEGKLKDIIITKTKSRRSGSTEFISLKMEDGKLFNGGFTKKCEKGIQEAFDSGMYEMKIIYGYSEYDFLMLDRTIYSVTIGDRVLLEEAKSRKRSVGLSVICGFIALMLFILSSWLFRNKWVLR
jgi:hypothetical protein